MTDTILNTHIQTQVTERVNALLNSTEEIPNLFDEMFDLRSVPYNLQSGWLSNEGWIRNVDRDIMVCLMDGYRTPCFSTRFSVMNGTRLDTHTTIYTKNFQFRYFQYTLVTGTYYESVSLNTTKIPTSFLYYTKLTTPNISTYNNGYTSCRGVGENIRKEVETHPTRFLQALPLSSSVQSQLDELTTLRERLATMEHDLEMLRREHRCDGLEKEVMRTQLEARDTRIEQLEEKVEETKRAGEKERKEQKEEMEKEMEVLKKLNLALQVERNEAQEGLHYAEETMERMRADLDAFVVYRERYYEIRERYDALLARQYGNMDRRY